MPPRQARNSFEGFLLIVSKELGHCGFRPNQHVRFIGEGLLRKVKQFLKPLGVVGGIPNEGLRECSLD